MKISRQPLSWAATMLVTLTGIMVGLSRSGHAVEIARWAMNEGQGTVAASSFGSPATDVTFFGSPQWTSHLLAPVPGNTAAIQLHGGWESGLIADSASGVLGAGARSITAWIRTMTTANATIFDAGVDSISSRFTLRLNNASPTGVLGALRLEVAGGFAVANTPVNDGQWHHIAVTFPEGGSLEDVKLYVDGVLDADQSTVPFSDLADSPVNTGEGLIRIGQRVNGEFSYDGIIDEVRYWDEELSQSAIADQLPAGPLPTFEFVVDRDSGNISLHNNFGTTVDEIVGYELRSAAGTLDPGLWTSIADTADADSGDHSFDSVNVWQKITNTVDPTYQDLSEFTLGASGGGLVDGGVLDLGNVWVVSPFEDITAEVIFAGGDRLPIGVRYIGNGGEPYLLGDLDLNGVIDVGDWQIFRANLLAKFPALSPAQSYLLGDLDNDGDNDRFDLELFESLYDEARGQGAFQLLLANGSQVPEPRGWHLLALAGLLLGWITTSHARALSMKTALIAIAAAVGLTTIFSSGPARADVLSYYDFESPNPFNDRAGTAHAVATIDTLVTIGPGMIGDAAVFGAGSLPAGNNTPAHWLTVPQNQSPDFGTSDLSISLWYKRAEPQGDMASSGGPDGIYDSLATAGVQLFILSNGTVNGRFETVTREFMVLNSPVGGLTSVPGQIEMDTGSGFQWHHIVYSLDRTSDNKSASLYIDGMLVANVLEGGAGEANGEFDSLIGKSISPTQNMQIGAANSAPADGSIDDLAFFDQALTPQEVQGLFNRTLTPLDFLERLKLQVNLTSGLVTLTNNTTNDLSFDYYEISSETSSLNLSGWSSFESQNNSANGFPAGDGSGNGWEVAGGSGDGAVGEVFLDGFSTFTNDSSAISLGNLFRTDGSQDLSFIYRDSVTGAFRQGLIEYVVGTPLAGDFNGDGVVDLADYTVWRNHLGAADESAFAAGTGNGNGVDTSDYQLWKDNFGSGASPASVTPNSTSVPEPATCLVAILGLAAIRWGRSARYVFFLLAAIPTLCQAAVTTDRLYTFGDDPLENPGNGFPLSAVYDSWGDPFTGLPYGVPGAYLDITEVVGGTYTNSVAPATSPGSLQLGQTNSYAAHFNGTSDYLRGYRLGIPESSASSADYPVGGSTGPLNYKGIRTRGFQLWVKPDSVGGAVQTILRDTTNHGLAISSDGTWVMRYGGGAVDSGVAVTPGEWAHAMVVVPNKVRGSSNFPVYNSILYINGEAIAATTGAYSLGTGVETPTQGDLVIGANLNAGGDATEFFSGTLDELEMFVSGTAETTLFQGSPLPRMQYGTFNAYEDNDYIRNAITTFGDLTGDGLITQQDIEVFKLGWQNENRVGDMLVGDLTSYAWGDLNFDGIVDIGDALEFHRLATAAGLAGLDFSRLGGVAVPEPASVVTCLLVGGCWMLGRRRSRFSAMGGLS